MKQMTKEQMERAQEEVKRMKGLQGELKTLDDDFVKLLREPQLPHLIERTVGKFKIKVDIIDVGKKMTVVSKRNWILMGYKPFVVRYENPRPLYKLVRVKDDGLLMSDSPQEMFLQYDAYKEAKGKVLVGGLGLGLYAHMIAEKKDVSEVVVIEIDSDIIKLCHPRHKKIRVLHDDIKKFIKGTKEAFDFIYIDIHYSTGAYEYMKTVKPMKIILEKRFPGIKSIFWGEEEMLSQYNPNYEEQKKKMLKK